MRQSFADRFFVPPRIVLIPKIFLLVSVVFREIFRCSYVFPVLQHVCAFWKRVVFVCSKGEAN